jgi:hypothetical protein
MFVFLVLNLLCCVLFRSFILEGGLNLFENFEQRTIKEAEQNRTEFLLEKMMATHCTM